MSVIDKATFTVVKTIPMGLKPHHVMASPTAGSVYVGEYGQNTVGVIDTRHRHPHRVVAGEPEPGGAHPRRLDRRPRAGALRDERGHRRHREDRHEGRQLLWNMPIGARPSEILVRPDGKTAYVSVRNENRLKVVDLETRTITGSVFIGVEPDTLSLTEDGHTLVVGLRGVPATAALLDTRTLAVRFVDLPGHTTTGHQWLSANGKFAFMAVESPGAIAVIDIASGTLVREIPYPGGPLPHGVFFEPEGLR